MKKVIPKRRTFTVREQLLGKLGPGGYGALLQQLEAVPGRPARKKHHPRRPQPKVAA